MDRCSSEKGEDEDGGGEEDEDDDEEKATILRSEQGKKGRPVSCRFRQSGKTGGQTTRLKEEREDEEKEGPWFSFFIPSPLPFTQMEGRKRNGTEESEAGEVKKTRCKRERKRGQTPQMRTAKTMKLMAMVMGFCAMRYSLRQPARFSCTCGVVAQ